MSTGHITSCVVTIADSSMEQGEQWRVALEASCSEGPIAAEKVIKELKSSDQCLELCQYIIQASFPASQEACFQAATLMKSAVLKDWEILTAEARERLPIALLEYVHRSGSSMKPFLSNTVVGVVAIVLKRGWGDTGQPGRDAFLSSVDQLLLSEETRLVALKALEAIVIEFGSEAATPMGLPWEFHERARADVETQHLQRIYVNAMGYFQAAVPGAAAMEPGPSAICKTCIGIMAAVLGWSFREMRQKASKLPGMAGLRPKSRVVEATASSGYPILSPGVGWADVLGSPPVLQGLFEAYAKLREHPTMNFSARQLLVQHCSLAASTFRSDAERQSYLTLMLHQGSQWLTGGDETEEIDACEAFLRLSQSCGVLILQLPEGIQAIEKFCEATVRCVQKVGGGEVELEQWELLLDAWSSLAQEERKAGGFLLKQGGYCARVFEAFVQKQLLDAAAEGESDEEEEEEERAAQDAAAASVGLLARVDPERAMAALQGQLADLQSRHQAHVQGGLGRCLALFQLLEMEHVVVLVAGHVTTAGFLDDAGPPRIPETIIEESPARAASNLIMAILGHAEFILQLLTTEQRDEAVSPRIVESLLWFLDRWCAAYVLWDPPGDGMAGRWGMALRPFHHSTENSRQLVDFCARFAAVSMLAWRCETAICAGACKVLRQVTEPRCRVLLTGLPAWTQLVEAWSVCDPRVASLTAETQRSCVEVLCRGTSKVGDPSHHLHQVLGPTQRAIGELCARGANFEADAGDVAMVASVITLLEQLRGIARGSRHLDPTGGGMPLCIAAFPLGQELLRIYVNSVHVEVGLLLLQWAEDLCEAQLPPPGAFPSPAAEVQNKGVLEFAIALARAYGAAKGAMKDKASLLQQEERNRELIALVGALEHIAARDCLLLSQPDRDPHASHHAARALFQGLLVVVPRVTKELLRFPDLSKRYFGLVAAVFEVYSDRMTELAREELGVLLGALCMGMESTHTTTSTASLEAIGALVTYHVESLTAGQPGLGSHAAGPHSVLRVVLDAVMRFLLYGEVSDEAVEHAGNALLPLIMCEQGRYNELLSELVAQQNQPAVAHRLQEALGALLGTNGIQANTEKENFLRFRANLQAFLVTVRSFLIRH